MVNQASIGTTQKLQNYSVKDLETKIAAIDALADIIRPSAKKKILLKDLESMLQAMGVKTVQSGGRDARTLKLFDEASGVNWSVGVLQTLQNGHLSILEGLNLKQFLERIRHPLSEQLKVLKTQNQSNDSKKIEEIYSRMFEIVGENSSEVELDVSQDEKDFSVRFSLRGQPYLRWSSQVPTGVAGANGHINQSAFLGWAPVVATAFQQGLRDAQTVVAEMDSLKQDYQAKIDYDAETKILSISHPVTGEPVYVSTDSVASVKEDVEIFSLELMSRLEAKTAILRAQLADVCARRELECKFTDTKIGTLDVLTATITSKNFGTADKPKMFEETFIINPLKVEEAEIYIKQGLRGRYGAFRTNNGVNKQPSADAQHGDQSKFKMDRLPMIPARSGQGILHLTDTTDMEKIRDAFLVLQSVELSNEDADRLELVLNSNFIDTHIIRVLLLSVTQGLDMNFRDLKKRIEGLGQFDPILHAIGHDKDGALEALAALSSTDAPVEKAGGHSKHGTRHIRRVYPEHVSKLLHILDYIAHVRCEAEGIEKLVVKLDASISTPEMKLQLKRAYGGPRGGMGPRHLPKGLFNRPKLDMDAILGGETNGQPVPQTDVQSNGNIPAAPVVVEIKAVAVEIEVPLMAVEEPVHVPAASAVPADAVPAPIAAATPERARGPKVQSDFVKIDRYPEVRRVPKDAVVKTPVAPAAVVPAPVAPVVVTPAVVVKEETVSVEVAAAMPDIQGILNLTENNGSKTMSDVQISQFLEMEDVPAQERFGYLHRQLRKDCGLSETELVARIKGRPQKPSLETPVTQQEVILWEGSRAVPSEAVLSVLEQILIDDNINIGVKDREAVKGKLNTAALKTARALNNLANNRAGLADLQDISAFPTELADLRIGVYATSEGLVEVLNAHGKGPEIAESVESIDADFIYSIEANMQTPSEGLRDVVLAIFEEEKHLTAAQKEAFVLAHGKEIARLGFMQTLKAEMNGAAAGHAHGLAVLEAPIVDLKKKLLSYFTTASGEQLSQADIQKQAGTKFSSALLTGLFGKSAALFSISRDHQAEKLESLKAFLKKLNKPEEVIRRFSEEFNELVEFSRQVRVRKRSFRKTHDLREMQP